MEPVVIPRIKRRKSSNILVVHTKLTDQNNIEVGNSND